ncbi:MAG: hypothetical protein ATN36_03030 [Epulopiscium sp. Nele67-Bin005]|nr:MAG: hypothetical protein ATN36_03030 [Epulopiscium sp. Nele67-Bin005]
MINFFKQLLSAYKLILFFIFIALSSVCFLYSMRLYSSVALFNPPKSLETITDNLMVSTLSTQSSTTSSSIYYFDIPIDDTNNSTGIIGVPNTQNNPIAFIFHDATTTDIHSYEGFLYLVEQLTNSGYLTISLDITSAFELSSNEPLHFRDLYNIFINQLQFLSNSISGNSHPYPINLTDKGDLSQVSLIGHGAGGLGAYALSLNSFENAEISSLLLITPQFIDTSLNLPIPTVPTGIILSQLDGEVRSLDGQRIFDNSNLSNELTAPISIVYLYGANHNYFNELLTQDDALKQTYVLPNSQRLSNSMQQDFLMNYASDFLNFYHSQLDINIGLDSALLSPNTLYSYPVLTSLMTPASLKIINPTNIDSETTNALGGETSTYNASISFLTESYMAPYDNAIGFQHPGLPEALGLIKLSWSVTSGTFTTAIPCNLMDISDYNSLSLWIALDPTDDLNKAYDSQSFVLQLKDSSKKVEQIILDGNSIALQKQAGELVTSNYQSQWSTFTPLSNIRIPLELFTQVDLTQIESLTIQFNQNNTGSIFIGDISLLR